MNADMRFDLHTHSTASDGTLSPTQLIAMAVRQGLGGIALTDHDTLDGVEEAMETGKSAGIFVIPGVEISTDSGDRELHILALLVDTGDQGFADFLRVSRGSRRARIEAIVDKLHRAGYSLRMDQVLAIAGDGSVGRPHVADALIAGGYVRDREEAFDNLLTQGKPGYVSRRKPTPHEAIGVIRKAKGIPIMAHPGFEGAGSHIGDLIASGLMGLEVRHPSHTPDLVSEFSRMAQSHGLLITGGSDYHGSSGGDGPPLGSHTASLSEVEELIRRRERLYGSPVGVDFFAWRSNTGIR